MKTTRRMDRDRIERLERHLCAARSLVADAERNGSSPETIKRRQRYAQTLEGELEDLNAPSAKHFRGNPGAATVPGTPWANTFYACPGAWLGNEPRGRLEGHVVVDVARISEALTFLKRRRSWRITGTEIARTPGGILVRIARRIR